MLRAWLSVLTTKIGGHGKPPAAGSVAIAAGADIKVLQRMLGHASAALTLDRYGHLLPGQAESVWPHSSAGAAYRPADRSLLESAAVPSGAERREPSPLAGRS